MESRQVGSIVFLTRHSPPQKADFVTKRIGHYHKLSLEKCACISQCCDDKLNDMLQSRNDTYREAETIYHWQETISRKATRYVTEK